VDRHTHPPVSLTRRYRLRCTEVEMLARATPKFHLPIAPGKNLRMDIDSALPEIDAPFNGQLPVDAIRAVQAHPAECIPRLIEIIRQATARVQAGEKLPGNGQLIAAYLLTEFQATEALPALVEAISLPEDQVDELFGDMIAEDLCRMLTVLDADNLKVTDRLIADFKICPPVRNAAAYCYLLRARDGRLSRGEVLRRISPYLKSALKARDDEAIEYFFGFFEDCGETEFFEEIYKAYVARIATEAALNQALDQALTNDDGARFERYIQRLPPAGIKDTVQEMSEWACYDSAEDVWDEMEDFDDDELDDAEFNYDDLDAVERDDLIDDDLDDSPEFRAQWEAAKQQVIGRIPPPEPPLPPPSEPIRYESPRTGRNDPCPCGSGKKYKKCCARA